MTIPAAFQLAVGHCRSGRLSQAEQICRDLLAQRPAFPEALHLLGFICAQTQRYDEAIGLLQKGNRKRGHHSFLDLPRRAAVAGTGKGVITHFSICLGGLRLRRVNWRPRRSAIFNVQSSSPHGRPLHRPGRQFRLAGPRLALGQSAPGPSLGGRRKLGANRSTG